METSNIATAAGPDMNWADERNASTQSRYAQDLTAWAHSLLDAARSQGYDASLTSMGPGGCGAPVLNVCDKAIPLGAIRYGQVREHGLDPEKWIASQVNGTQGGLSPEERTASRQAQLAARERATALGQVATPTPRALLTQRETNLQEMNDVHPHTAEHAGQQAAALAPMMNGVAPPIRNSIDGGNCWDPPLHENQVTAGPVRQAVSAYPIQPLPVEVLSADPLMQAWYESILAAAREIDPNATIDNSIGIARVLVNGQQTILTGPMYDEFAQGYATPEQQVNRGVTGTPIALTPEQLLRVAQYQVQALNSSFSDLSAAEAQRQFDAMRPSLNGVPGEVSLSIGSQRFPVALQDGKIVLSGAPESWDSITGNPPLAGPSSAPGPRLVTYSNGMQGYVGPDGTTWKDPAASQTSPAWGSSATPFDGYGGSGSRSGSTTDPSRG